MEILEGPGVQPDGPTRRAQGPSVLTIGTFDGVHRGHQALHRRVVEEAERLDAAAGVVTFDRHPLQTLLPDKAPCMLSTLDQRLTLLEAEGITAVFVLEFTRAVADLSPEEFVRYAVVDAMRARKVVVGPDFRFGHDRSGDVDLLEELGERHGFEVEIVRLEENQAGEKISSTRVRGFVAEGEVGEAAKLLGRPYRLAGTVVRGEGRGSKIGFPTANLAPHPGGCLPGLGVYAGWWFWRGEVLPGVINVGVRPTFERGRPDAVVEIHVFGLDGELYEQPAEVGFEERLRGEQKFASVDELVEQIRRDAEAARRILGVR